MFSEEISYKKLSFITCYISCLKQVIEKHSKCKQNVYIIFRHLRDIFKKLYIMNALILPVNLFEGRNIFEI